MNEVTAYINAGGRGTRLDGVVPADPVNGIAKALVEVGQPPIKLVDHHVNKLRRAGIERVIVGIGHQASVGRYINERYSNSDEVLAIGTGRQLGSGAELQTVMTKRPDLFNPHIYVCNVDTILDISEEDFLRFHKAGSKALSIALTETTGVPNEGAYYLDHDQTVIYSAEIPDNSIALEDAQAQATSRASSTGAVIVDRDYLQHLELPRTKSEVSLYRHVIGAAVCSQQVQGYNNGTRMFIDVGTRRTWEQAAKTDLLSDHLCYTTG